MSAPKLDFVLLTVLSLLAGCEAVPKPTILAATPRTVTIQNVGTNTIGEAAAQAQTHCAKLGRDAELVPDGVADFVATFRCTNR